MEYIRNMINDKQTRFNQFLNSIEGNNPKTLSIRLKDGENGIDREKSLSK